MKYIKIYESWLNEAESAKFDANKPQTYPMLKLTQGSFIQEMKKISEKLWQVFIAEA